MSESLEVNQETLSITTAGSDITSQKSEPSPLNTPQTSKRAMTARKLRPKSVIDGNEEKNNTTPDLLEASSRSRTPDSSHSHLNGGRSLTPNYELETVHENSSDSQSATPLTHLGKARPKRPKKHAPSRGAVVSASPASSPVTDTSSFFSSTPAAAATATPSFNVSKSTPEHKSALSQVLARSRNASREDISSSSLSDRLSPLPASRPRATSQSSKPGLSCLASAAADEESPPPPPQARPSPEKKGQSISDIFAKTASSKLTRPKGVEERAVSPTVKKAAESGAEASSPASPDPAGGKKTPEGVIKRHGVGHGGNADLMAEIREKRASMVPKNLAEEELSPKSELPKEKPAFGNVKLR